MLMLAPAASVSEASMSSSVLVFFSLFSLDFPGNFFLNRVCVLQISQL